MLPPLHELWCFMKIGILQCGHLPPEVSRTHGTYFALYESMLAGHGFRFSHFSAVDMEFPDSPTQADGWLIGGSKYGVYDDVPFIAPLSDFIRRIDTARVPLFGICFGHQIIAQALGGTVEKFAGGWAVGHHEYAFDDLGQLALTAWHQDQVMTLPANAQTTAQSDFCSYAGLAYGDHIRSIQPHPEFDASFVRDLLATRKNDPGYPKEIIDRAYANASKPTDIPKMTAHIADFFKSAAA